MQSQGSPWGAKTKGVFVTESPSFRDRRSVAVGLLKPARLCVDSTPPLRLPSTSIFIVATRGAARHETLKKRMSGEQRVQRAQPEGARGRKEQEGERRSQATTHKCRQVECKVMQTSSCLCLLSLHPFLPLSRVPLPFPLPSCLSPRSVSYYIFLPTANSFLCSMCKF